MAAITNNSVQNLLNILDGILLATVDIHHQLLPQSWLNCIDELCPILKSIFREDDISTEDISEKFTIAFELEMECNDPNVDKIIHEHDLIDEMRSKLFMLLKSEKIDFFSYY
jgi:hypothetical protein